MKKITLVIFMSLLSFLGYAQFPQGFEGGVPPTQWHIMDNGVGTLQSWKVNAPAALYPAYAGTTAAFIDREFVPVGSTSEDWLVTPQFLVPTNGQLRFFTRMTLTGNNQTLYQLRVSTTSQTNQASFTVFKQWTETELGTAMAAGGSTGFNVYGEIVENLTTYVGQQIYIAFVRVHTQVGATVEGDRWLIDEVNVAERCADPVTLTASSISATSAILDWTSTGPATQWEIEMVPNPGIPTGTPTATANSKPYTYNGLTPGTQYYYYVRSVCSANNKSNWVGPFIFTTTPLGQTCAGPIVVGSLPYVHTSNTGLYGDVVDGSPGASCGITGNYLNGNDVFYAFTPSFTGVVDISMTPTGNNSGVFVYGSCSDVGSVCLAGVANTGGGIRNIPFFSVTAGVTYYIVISTSGTPQTLPYTLTIQQVACPPPNNLGASGITQTSATLTWGNPSGATAWEYVFQPAGTGLPLGAGTPIATTSASVGGLTANTNYEFYVRVDCGGGTYSAWAGPFQFRTLCDAFPIPFTEGFNSTSTTQPCWTVLNLNADTNAWNMDYATNPYEGNQSASIVATSVANNDWLISPQVSGLNNNQRLKFRYRVESATSPCTFEVRLSTNGASPADMTTVLVAPASYNNTTYIERIVNLSAFSGNVNIGWYVAPGANGSRIYIDQVIIEDMPACPEPTAITVSNITGNSATINWVPGNTETSWQVLVQPTGSPAPTLPTQGVTVNATTTYNATGLNSSTNYDVYVLANCGATNSIWVGPVPFRTPQVAATLPFSDTFEGNFDWDTVNGTQTNKWFVGTAVNNGGTRSMYISNNNGLNNTYTNTTTSVAQTYRDIQIPVGANQINVAFDWRAQGESTFDYFRVWIVPVTFVPTAGTQITAAADRQNISGNINLNGTFTTRNIVVNAAPLAGQTVRLVFEWRNDGSAGTQPPAAIDNVNVTLITCPAPTALTTVSTTQNTATLQWTAGAGETQWEIVVQAPGSGQPTGASTIIPANTNPFTVTGLNPATQYEYYVRAVCGPGDVSTWSGPSTFFTQCSILNVPFYEGFNSTSGTQQCWTVVNANADTDLWNMDYATNPFEGNQVAVLVTDFNNGANDDWLISPTLNLSATPGAKRLKFHYRVQSATEPNDFRVMISTTGAAPANFTETLIPLGTYNNTTYIERIVNLIDGTGTPYSGNVNIAWHVPPAGLDGWRLYIDNVIVEDIPACPNPTLPVVTAVTQNSATLSWTAGFNETQWEIVVQAPGSGAPTGASTIITANTNPFTVTGLNPSTQYEFYIRAYCNATEQSIWVGPTTFTTTQIPATLNYVEDFESGTQMTFTNGTQTNKWAVGTATSNGGAQALYISNNNGASNAYTNNSTTVAHAYRDIFIPAGTNLMDLSFDWKAVGESCCDYLRVWTVPASYNPIPGTLITAAASGGQQLTANLNQNGTWRTETFELTGTPYAGQIMRLVFEWRNDSSVGTNPPAAIDNIILRIPTCPEPFDLMTSGQTGSPDITLSWTPGGTETQWQVVIQPQGAGVPTGPGVTVNNTPSYQYTATHGVFYEYWVQAVCGASDSSDWVGPYVFSVYAPPGCASIDVVGVGVDIIDNQVLLCPGQSGQNVELSASYFGIGATTSYEVSSIDYAPPFPFSGGTEMNVTIDDTWSPVVNLPFNFCFFGNSYSTAKVGSNGIIGFGVDPTDTTCAWAFNQTIPNTTFPEKNAIYGVYQDTDPSWDPLPTRSINYQVLGNYPCRALVVNFNDLHQFSCGASTGPQTTQIVIYEISNIIEVYVNRRVPCTSWQNGAGVIGIQNAAGTTAYVPPGRNTGSWSATNEAWRFTPNAPAPVTLEWIQNGNVIGTNSNVVVNVTDDTTITAQATYTVCDGSNVVISSDIDIVVTEELPTLEPLELSACSTDANPVFDLTLNQDYVLSNSTAANYDVDFYLTEAEAIADVAGTEIANPQAFVGTDGQTIWMNITSNAGCTVIKSFTLTFGNHVPAFTLDPSSSPVNVCQGATTTVTVQPTNFNLADAFYEWTLPDNTIATTVTPFLEVPVNGLVGTYTVKVKTDCETTQSFVVNINTAPVVTASPTASPTCANATGGVIEVSPAGNYEYSIDNGATYVTNNTFSGLQAQTPYTFTVRDLTTGCIASVDYTFPAIPGVPDAPTVRNPEDITQPTCTTAGSFTVSAPVNGPVTYSNLFISEVTDADTGSLTYIEIFNGTGSTVNLSNYKLKLYNNGSATPSCDFTLSGSLANNATHVVKVSSDANLGGVVPNQTVTTCAGVNIDDNIRLTTFSGTEIDIWGTTNGTVFTPSGQTGYAYRRLQSAVAPSTTWNAADWDVFDPEDYTNVGTYAPLTTNYQYSIDNGTTWQTSPVFGGLTPGTYNVVVVEMTNPTCISAPTEVIINPVVQPTASISYAGTPYCEGAGSATITFSGTSGGTYSVAPVTGLVIDASGTVDLNASTPGTYTVSYTIAGTLNCPEVVATADIVILTSTTPITDFSYPTPVCVLDANITPTGVVGFTAGGSYSSTAGLIIDAATGEINVTGSTPGTYTVTYSVAATNCNPAASSTFEVTISPSVIPVVEFSYTAVVCNNGDNLMPITAAGFDLTGTFTAPSGLVIDPVTGEINVAASTPGVYVVTYTVADDLSICQEAASDTATVSIIGDVVISFENGCQGATYVVTALPVDGSFNPDTSTYAWTGPNGFTASEQSITASAVGVYEVTVTTVDGCSSTTQFTVDTISCMIPKGISPNGDGKNDNWNLDGLDARKVSVFNRYGMVVYEHGVGYTNQWYGQSKSGEELPDGTYYYVVEAGDGSTKTGWVYINREQ